MRKLLGMRTMPVIARITTVPRERSMPTDVAIDAEEVDGLPEPRFAPAHDLFLAGPAAPAVMHAGRLGTRRLVELRSALAWTFALRD